jgi:hypothetical protein
LPQRVHVNDPPLRLALQRFTPCHAAIMVGLFHVIIMESVYTR